MVHTRSAKSTLLFDSLCRQNSDYITNEYLKTIQIIINNFLQHDFSISYTPKSRIHLSVVRDTKWSAIMTSILADIVYDVNGLEIIMASLPVCL